MTKWVEYVEPLGSGKYGAQYIRIKVDEVIEYMKNEYQEQYKNHYNYPYKSDQDALDDFMVIHWAKIIDDVA